MIQYVWISFLCLLMIVGAATTYQIKYQAELTHEQATNLNREIDALEEEISRLKAHWSFLNQPHRLQALVEENQDLLPLVALNAHQIAQLKDVPAKAPVFTVIPLHNPLRQQHSQLSIQSLIMQKQNEPTLTDLITAERQ